MIADVVIVGGGVIGCAIADALAIEGLSVRLLERDRVASGASGAAAGMLPPISEARAGGALLEMGIDSLGRFPSLCERLFDETGIDPELEQSGLVHLVEDESGRQALEMDLARLPGSLATEARPHWRNRDTLVQDLKTELPAIAGGFLTSFAYHVRPPRLVQALAAAARQRGVSIESGVAVEGLQRQGDRVTGVETTAGPLSAGAVVLAAGAWTPSLVASAAPDLVRRGACAIQPVRGQILSLAPPLPAIREILWADDVYLVPKRDGTWIVGATEEPVGFDCRVTAEGVAGLVERACRYLPALRGATFERAWAGLRPVSSDGLPWIGSVPQYSGLVVAAGHGRNGVLLAPLTAERIRDELLGKGSSADDPCRLDREVVASRVH